MPQKFTIGDLANERGVKIVTIRDHERIGISPASCWDRRPWVLFSAPREHPDESLGIATKGSKCGKTVAWHESFTVTPMP